jgi:hypothetical protein
MKQLSIRYPWKGLEKGQGFFIPCLDTAAIKREGLNKALSMRLFDARAEPCIRGGLIGVWFYRLPLQR